MASIEDVADKLEALIAKQGAPLRKAVGFTETTAEGVRDTVALVGIWNEDEDPHSLSKATLRERVAPYTAALETALRSLGSSSDLAKADQWRLSLVDDSEGVIVKVSLT